MSYLIKATVVAMLGLILLMPSAIAAQSTATTRQNAISENCTVVKDSIELQQRRDLVARTNRGREYENIAKQLDAFVQRLNNNDINNQEFADLLNRYRTATTQFRSAYSRYDDSLHALQRIDCKNRPAEFAAELDRARVLRAETGQTVQQGSEVLLQFRELAVSLKTQLQQLSSDPAGSSQ